MRLQAFAVPVLLAASLACGNPQVGTLTSAAGASLEAPQGSLQLQWEYSTAPFAPLSVAVDSLGRPYLYIAQLDGGLLVLDVSNAKGPARVGALSRAQLSGLAATYVAQKDDRLYLSLGNFFAADGARAGLAVVSVADPSRPKVLDTWISDTVARGASSVLIEGDYAYLAAMNAGIHIFDISAPDRVRLLSSLQPNLDFPRSNPNSVQRPNARGAAIYKQWLVLAYDAGGIRVIDVADKRNPREISRYINAGITGKQQAYNNVVINWPYVYAAIDYCGMEILDLQDIQNIRQVDWWNPWNCQSASNNWFNSPGHTNQLAFDKERNLVYLSAGDSELQVVDVSDPSRPRLAAGFGAPKNGLGVWGMGMSSSTIYLTYVQTPIPFKSDWSGIKALTR